MNLDEIFWACPSLGARGQAVASARVACGCSAGRLQRFCVEQTHLWSIPTPQVVIKPPQNTSFQVSTGGFHGWIPGSPT